MAPIPLPLGPASDKAKARQGGGATITNGYVEQTEGGKTNFAIYTRPRLKLFSTVASGQKGRGGIVSGDLVYTVFGETCYKISGGGIATAIGTVLGQKPVTISFNRKATRQFTITADTKNYIVESDVITEVADVDLPSGVHSNCHSNGFTVYGINDGLAYSSAENDSGDIDAPHFSEAERSADGGVRVLDVGEDFWYWGEKSLEIFRFDNGAAFPFSPLLGAGQGEGSGCGARFSPTNVAGVVVWVNDLATVVASSGGERQVISTHEVDRDIAATIKSGGADDITGFAVHLEGHQFYFLRSPTWCWMRDMVTGFWFPVTSYQSDTFRCGYYIYAFNKDLLLDATDGNIYEFTFDAIDDEGDPCILEIETSPLNAFPDGYICDALSLDVQRGVGDAESAAHIQDPQILLKVSRDGGMTWGREYSRSAGTQGKYAKDVRFNRLGSCNGSGMGFKLSMPEPVTRAVFQAAVDVRPLRN